WKAATTSAGSQTVYYTKKGADNKWSGELVAAGVLSSAATSYTWTNAEPYTSYQFYIHNSGASAGSKSNRVFCHPPPGAVTVSRPSPSNVVGSAQSSTSIVWSWVVNATDNSDIEYSLDGGTWTSLSSSTASSLTST